MFDLPTREDVEEVKVTEGSVLNGTAPLLRLALKAATGGWLPPSDAMRCRLPSRLT